MALLVADIPGEANSWRALAYRLGRQYGRANHVQWDLWGPMVDHVWLSTVGKNDDTTQKSIGYVYYYGADDVSENWPDRGFMHSAFGSWGYTLFPDHQRLWWLRNVYILGWLDKTGNATPPGFIDNDPGASSMGHWLSRQEAEFQFQRGRADRAANKPEPIDLATGWDFPDPAKAGIPPLSSGTTPAATTTRDPRSPYAGFNIDAALRYQPPPPLYLGSQGRGRLRPRLSAGYGYGGGLSQYYGRGLSFDQGLAGVRFT